MKAEAKLFLILIPFFVVVAVFYGYMTDFKELMGLPAITMTGLMFALIGWYLLYTRNHLSKNADGPNSDYMRPEDDLLGQVDQGAGELGDFAPQSWWPFPLALGGAIIFMGIAVGWWLVYIGVAVAAVAIVGWVFEFYRGEHAH